MILAQAQIDAIMDALIDTGGPWDPAATFVGIASAVDNQGEATVLADLTFPDLADYPRQAVTAWGTPYTTSNGMKVADGPAMPFAPPDNTTPTSVVAWYAATLGTGGALLGFRLLTSPRSLVTTEDVLTIIPRVTVDPDGQWALDVVFNG